MIPPQGFHLGGKNYFLWLNKMVLVRNQEMREAEAAAGRNGRASENGHRKEIDSALLLTQCSHLHGFHRTQTRQPQLHLNLPTSAKLLKLLCEERVPYEVTTFGKLSICETSASSLMDFFKVFALPVMWQGVLCANEDYKVKVPWRVTAQEGLCVLIPCKFTYENMTEAAVSPYGYWFIEGKTKSEKAVASSNVSEEIYEETRGRFKLVGDLRRRDCSLSINDVRRSDERTYYFRYEHNEDSRIQFSYMHYPLRITVVELQDQPKLLVKSPLIEGGEGQVFCTAPGRCLGTPPTITWRVDLRSSYSIYSYSVDNVDGSQTHRSKVTFNVSRIDNHKHMNCTAYFPSINASTTSSVSLQIEYKGLEPKISLSITSEGHLNKHANSSTENILEGRYIFLNCSVKRSQLASMAWVKEDRIIKESDTESQNILTLSLPSITLEDGGKYWCVAKNKHVTANNSLLINVEYKPRPAAMYSSFCKRAEDVIMCICVVEANPAPTIKWKINENTLPESYLNGSMLQMFPVYHAMKYGTLIMKVHGSVSFTITCMFENQHGNETLILMSPGVTTGAIAGIVVAITLLLVLLVGISICITRKTRKKDSTGNRTMNKTLKDTTVDHTYQELQWRQSDTYGELKINENGILV
ncbi:hypothetical protein NDU88_010875 [Pleurodeles waltl]|uniref:Ig-like domain-containing protein n=1 Tax=Pleurodeles waltl TaxID=8319 RepID=A0AAV7PW41_PLEWA|nr:hypothetical protein NDU88_010875 [Pleurodeles waltl]